MYTVVYFSTGHTVGYVVGTYFGQGRAAESKELHPLNVAFKPTNPAKLVKLVL